MKTNEIKDIMFYITGIEWLQLRLNSVDEEVSTTVEILGIYRDVYTIHDLCSG